jgi:hypothetical protein
MRLSSTLRPGQEDDAVADDIPPQGEHYRRSSPDPPRLPRYACEPPLEFELVVERPHRVRLGKIGDIDVAVLAGGAARYRAEQNRKPDPRSSERATRPDHAAAAHDDPAGSRRPPSCVCV